MDGGQGRSAAPRRRQFVRFRRHEFSCVAGRISDGRGVELDAARRGSVRVPAIQPRGDGRDSLQHIQRQMESVATEDLAGLAAAVFAGEPAALAAGWRAEECSACRLAFVADSVEDLRQKIDKILTLLPERAELKRSQRHLLLGSRAGPGNGGLLPLSGTGFAVGEHAARFGGRLSVESRSFSRSQSPAEKRTTATVDALSLSAAGVRRRRARTADGRLARYTDRATGAGRWWNYSPPICSNASASVRHSWPGTAMANTSPCTSPAACRARICCGCRRSAAACARKPPPPVPARWSRSAPMPHRSRRFWANHMSQRGWPIAMRRIKPSSPGRSRRLMRRSSNCHGAVCGRARFRYPPPSIRRCSAPPPRRCATIWPASSFESAALAGVQQHDRPTPRRGTG